jgi:hypothetical protein
MVLGLLTLGTTAAAAELGAESPPAATVVQRTQLDPDALDRSIGEVLERREYDWRLPRQLKPDEAGQGVVGAFAQGVVETVRSWSLAAWRWIRKVAAWIRDVAERLRERIFGPRLPPKLPGGSGVDLVTVTQVLIWVTLATVVSVLVLFGWRMWRARTPGLVVAKPGGVAVPDVADERVTADQLPEEGWLALAQELMGRGDLRLAVRALYLACLAHLARREWVRIARHKSNRDYGIELSRRAREHVDPQSAFAESIQLFDRVWYGLHEATNEHVARLQANFERIRGA